MGWRINLVENNLELSPAAIEDIKALGDECIETSGNYLYFNSDHLEHMDYVWFDEVQAIIAKHKLSGQILFSSSEGDNRNTGWGYRFDNGAMTRLKRNAARQYVPEEEIDENEVAVTIDEDATSLDTIKAGQTIVIGFFFGGTTSYEKSKVGDILPDGTIVVDGREYSSQNGYKTNGSWGGGKFSLHLVKDISEELIEV